MMATRGICLYYPSDPIFDSMRGPASQRGSRQGDQVEVYESDGENRA